MSSNENKIKELEIALRQAQEERIRVEEIAQARINALQEQYGDAPVTNRLQNLFVEQAPPISLLTYPNEIHSWIITLKQIQRSLGKDDIAMINQAICYTRGEIQRFATSLDIPKIRDLDHLEKLLKEAFLHEKPAAQKLQELLSEKQRPSELVHQFYSRIRGKAIDYAKNSPGIRANDITMSIFKGGMLPSIGRRVLEQSKASDDQDELLTLAKRFEAIDLIYRDSPEMSLGAAVVDSRDRNSAKEPGVNHRVEYKNKGNYKYEKGKCFNCGRLGHMKVDCKIPKCTNCGKPGHYRKDCWQSLACIRCQEFGHSADKCMAPNPIEKKN